MNHIVEWTPEDRRELFQEAAARLGITAAIVEKDFWVTWMLAILFDDATLTGQLMFKGGTSLSKVYGVIERFSEDIDLILDWQFLTTEDPKLARSKTQDGKLSKHLNEQAKAYIKQTLLPLIRQVVNGVCTVTIDADDGFVVNVGYPTLFTDNYLRPEIRLEIGPMAAWNPHEMRSVSSLVASVFPEQFKRESCDVNVVLAKRTFWEKATILHAEAHRPKEKPLPMRYSRHYYDLSKMANTAIKQDALADLALLTQVVEFKKRFYSSGWANYDLARPGNFKLVPGENVIRQLTKDYEAMRNMIYGHYPDFSELIKSLQDLENEINQL